MKQLPTSPDFSHLKKQAKQLLRGYKDGEPTSVVRIREFLPASLSAEEMRLHDAQSCIAREYGFASWTALKAHVEAIALRKLSNKEAQQRWLRYVYGEGYDSPRPALAIRMLQDRPDLLGDDPYLACAAGDEKLLRDTLATDPEWIHKAGGAMQMPPLIAVTHSGLVRDERFADALVNCARLLLDHGADPNQTWISPDSPDYPLSALFGAAGKNHSVAMTQLLLERGANPDDNESLYHSMESSDPTCTRLLLEAGATVDGTNAMGHALDFDRPEGLRLLLEHGGNPGHPGASDFPLFHALKRGRSVEHIQMLLDAGADKHARNKGGYTPYQFALLYGQTEAAALLRTDEPDPLSQEDQFVAACACGDSSEAARFLAMTPDVVQRLSERQLRQLPNMAAQENFAAVKTMVEAGWPIDAQGGDWNASALNLAVFRGDAAMTEFLLAHGADWKQKHGFGGNARGTLGYASNNNVEDFPTGDWLACAKLLVAHGMQLPPDEDDFSEEIDTYFDGLRSDRS